jgi:hypothetical protein
MIDNKLIISHQFVYYKLINYNNIADIINSSRVHCEGLPVAGGNHLESLSEKSTLFA